MSRLQSMLDELRRRRVFRVAAVYAVVAFVIWQAAEIAFPALNLPEWALTLVVVLTLLGFPIALVLAWALEITPKGVRRTQPVAEQSVTGQSRTAVSPGPVALAATFVILAAAVGGWFFVLRDSGSTLVRERIVVVPFENRTGDPTHDELGNLAAEWIANGLSQAGLFEVVPMRIVDQRLEENPVGDELRDLADYTESRTLVTGSFYLRGDSIEFHAELLDAQSETPALLRAVEPVKGAVGDPMAAIESVKEQAAGALAVQLDTEWPNPELFSPPPSLEAYREHMKGTDLFHRGDWRGSAVHFRRAIELDSTYIHPTQTLVHCHQNMGELATADSLLRILEAQRSHLTPAERAHLDWTRAIQDGDVEAEYRAAKEELRLNPFAVYDAAFSAHRSNRQREAVELLSRRNFTTNWQRNWAPWWYNHLRALHGLGEHEEELEIAREAQAAHPDRWIFLEFEAWALAALGRLDELEEVLAEISRQATEPNYNPGVAMRRTAVELKTHGHEEAAVELLERTIAFYESSLVKEQAGDPPARWYRDQLAQTLYLSGRYSEALPLYESLLRPESWGYLGWLGVTYARLGEREKALEYSDQLAEVEGDYLRGWPEAYQASIAAVLGERERATDLMRRSFSSGTHFGGLWIHGWEPFWSLADYQPFQELVRPKE